jgi:hypothetical protein
MNNDTDEVRRRVSHVLRDIESSLGRGDYKEGRGGLIADLKNSRIKCLNISDRIVYWTLDHAQNSLTELLDVCFRFNWLLNTYNFPVRGALVYDKMDMIYGAEVGAAGGMYNVNTIFGKGLINAHLKCEGQMWAGSTIDKSLEDLIMEHGGGAAMLDPISIKHMVPYKQAPEGQLEEYALRLVTGELNDVAYDNLKKSITEIFKGDSKGMEGTSHQKLANTIAFAERFKS